MMIRRAVLLLAVVGAALALAAGTALAATIQCTTGEVHTICYGTEQSDSIRGSGSADDIDAKGGDDTVYGAGDGDAIFGREGNDTLDGGSGGDFITGEAGNDTISGGSGGDFIFARDGARDVISCGEGNDTVHFDEGIDLVSPDCENRFTQ